MDDEDASDGCAEATSRVCGTGHLVAFTSAGVNIQHEATGHTTGAATLDRMGVEARPPREAGLTWRERRAMQASSL